MAEPTDVKEEVNNENVESQNLNTSVETENQTESKVWTDEYPKWQKSISKEYWGNEKLAKFDSLNSVIKNVLNPETKAPESYDIDLSDETLKGKLVEQFKKSDLSNEDAKGITEIIKGSIKKADSEDNLKEIVGLADYEVEKAYAEKAYKAIFSEEDVKALEKADIRHNPLFFKFASAVGKNLGDDATLDFKEEQKLKPKSKDPFMDMLLGRN